MFSHRIVSQALLAPPWDRAQPRPDATRIPASDAGRQREYRDPWFGDIVDRVAEAIEAAVR